MKIHCLRKLGRLRVFANPVKKQSFTKRQASDLGHPDAPIKPVFSAVQKSAVVFLFVAGFHTLNPTTALASQTKPLAPISTSAQSEPELSCFQISKIEYVNTHGDIIPPPWQRYATNLPLALPSCFTATDINALIPTATAQLVADGWVTARLGIANQDLSTGVLKLTLVVGTFDELLVPEDIPASRWQRTLTVAKGKPINLSDIEQTVEQLNRLPSQKATINLVPSASQGMSNLALDIQDQGPLFRGTLGYSENQSKTTTATFAWDRPFVGTDQLNLSVSHDALNTLQNYSINANWSVGLGDHTLKITSRDKINKRAIEGAYETFISETTSEGLQFDYTQRLYRNNDTLFDFIVTGARDKDRSYIDGTEIDVQARDQAFGEVALRLSAASSVANWVVTLSQQRGMPQWFGDDDPIGLPAGRPTHRYELLKLNVNRTQTFPAANNNRMVLTNNFVGQHSHDNLHGANQFSVGGRGSVRGFSSSLTAESGWYLSNQISHITQKDHTLAPYFALDIGEVSGPSTAYLEGTQIVGFGFGQKITSGALTFEAELSKPMYGPPSLVEVTKSVIYLAVTGAF